jgi:SpoIID/LytB domain protein
MDGEHSRRRFLVRGAALLGGSMLLGGPLLVATCRRKPAATATAILDAPALGADLDEPENAASFRPPLPAAEPVIRVRVLKVRGPSLDPSQALHVGEDGQWIRLRVESSAGGFGGAGGVALSAPVAIAMEPTGWSLTDAKGFRPALQSREALELALLDGQAASMIAVAKGEAPRAGSPRYPGTLRLVSRHDLATTGAAGSGDPQGIAGSFDVINHVPLESYLPGVLAGELFNTWHPETFAAQAVAARSFACTEAAVFAARRHFDLTNSAASQMYLGGAAHSRARAAAAETRGLVLAYAGLLVSGYYSSCCGGAAARAADAIGPNPVNLVAPLDGRAGPDVCSGAPGGVYQWSVEQPIETLTRRLVAYGHSRRMKELAGLTRLASVEAIALNANGRPTRMRVVDEGDSAVELRAEDFRRAANHSGPGLNPPRKPLRSSHLTATFGPGSVTFDGYGFGHGVGLCQYGAQALATGGTDHGGILRWYYPGVELAQAYV